MLLELFRSLEMDAVTEILPRLFLTSQLDIVIDPMKFS